MVHIYNRKLLSHKKEQILTICDNMDETKRYYAKWNNSDREKQIPYDFTYLGNIKNKINEKQTETDS